MTTRMARRSHFFDQTINELKIGYASRLNEKNNKESLLKKLTEDFSLTRELNFGTMYPTMLRV